MSPTSLAYMSERVSIMSRLCSGLSYRVRHESNLVDGIIFPKIPGLYIIYKLDETYPLFFPASFIY